MKPPLPDQSDILADNERLAAENASLKSRVATAEAKASGMESTALRLAAQVNGLADGSQPAPHVPASPAGHRPAVAAGSLTAQCLAANAGRIRTHGSPAGSPSASTASIPREGRTLTEQCLAARAGGAR